MYCIFYAPEKLQIRRKDREKKKYLVSHTWIVKTPLPLISGQSYININKKTKKNSNIWEFRILPETSNTSLNTAMHTMLKNGQQTPVLLGSKIEPRDSTSIKSLVNEPNTPTDMYHPKIKTEYDMTIKKESPTSTEPLKETTKDTSKDTPKETLICKWSHCYREFQQAELLYHHLCQEHVGRKSQKNLQLKCQWDNCTSKTEKRDHMTSHLRVHVPLKPFACSTCSKRFKRPQDLKKHLKIHLSDLGIDAPKKKRGPKVGSKRVNSKSFHKVSYDQVPAIGSASQPRFNHYAPMQASQPVSYEHWVQMEMPHYTPVYSPALAERVQAISAPTLYVQGFENREPVVAATQFFTRLSTNMAYQVPNIQNQHLYVPNYVGRPDNLYLHSTAHSSDNSVKTSSSSSPIETSVPTTHHTDNKRSPLPAIHYVPQSNIPLVHSHVQPHYSANEVRPLPSLSSISMVTPKYVIDQNLPKYNRTYDTFSTNQKSCADEEEEIYDSDVSDDEISDMMNKVNLSDKNANEEEYDSDEEDFIATFKRVNILKDYAICTLLEEEYDTEDEPEPVLQPDVTESKSFDAHLMTFPEILI